MAPFIPRAPSRRLREPLVSRIPIMTSLDERCPPSPLSFFLAASGRVGRQPARGGGRLLLEAVGVTVCGHVGDGRARGGEVDPAGRLHGESGRRAVGGGGARPPCTAVARPNPCLLRGGRPFFVGVDSTEGKWILRDGYNVALFPLRPVVEEAPRTWPEIFPAPPSPLPFPPSPV